MALSFQLLPRDVAQFMLLVVGFEHAGDAAARAAWANLAMPSTVAAVSMPGHAGSAIRRRCATMSFSRASDASASLVGELLSELGVAYCAIESNPTLVARHRARGLPVVFGDASNPEMLRRLH